MEPMEQNYRAGGDDLTIPPVAAGTAASVKLDERAIRKIAGEAVCTVDGVLDLAGGLAEVIHPDDVANGITVETMPDKRVQVQAKIVTEYGKNIPAIVNAVAGQVATALQSMAGVTVSGVDVEITDTMTRADYEASRNKRAPQ